MALSFPNSPTDGELYTDTTSGNRWVWDSANTVWKSTSTFTQTITVSSTQPGSPVVGQLWWSQDYGRLFVYYNDGNSSQWVEANPADQTAGLVFNTANAAYGRANTALQNTSSTFAGALGITGNVSIGTSTVPSDISIIQTSNTKLEITAPGQRRIYSLGVTTSNYLLNSSGGAAILFDRLASSSDELAFETHHQGTSHAERMRITKEGYIKAPYQPRFFIRSNVTYNAPANNTEMVFSDIYVNVGSNYSTSTGRFTAPVAGTYYFHASMHTQPNSEGRWWFAKNGTQAIGVGGNGGSTDWSNTTGALMITLAAGDYISVFIQSGDYIHGDPNWGGWGGWLIG